MKLRNLCLFYMKDEKLYHNIKAGVFCKALYKKNNEFDWIGRLVWWVSMSETNFSPIDLDQRDWTMYVTAVK